MTMKIAGIFCILPLIMELHILILQIIMGLLPGAAEKLFGKIFKEDFKPYRDELIISSKAGWKMWEGPYGDWGSKKYLVASLDQSLQRMGLDYVDIFYHHRPDPVTPLEETMGST